jgi:hypothetical protein
MNRRKRNCPNRLKQQRHCRTKQRRLTRRQR